MARPDAAFFEVSPPDRWGYMSCSAAGVSMNAVAKEHARTVIAQVNDCAPDSFVNHLFNIAQNDGVVSVNSALMVDLTGQVYAEGVGFRQISCTGGQTDFVRGAQLARRGKSFIALSSAYVDKATGERRSKIVLAPPPGTPVTTPRADVQYLVTEHGCVNLKNLTLRDRVRAVIRLADPAFRELLASRAREVGLLF